VLAHDVVAVRVSISLVCCGTHSATPLTLSFQIEKNVQIAVDNVAQVIDDSKHHADMVLVLCKLAFFTHLLAANCHLFCFCPLRNRMFPLPTHRPAPS
jgi:hypothetical protein